MVFFSIVCAVQPLCLSILCSVLANVVVPHNVGLSQPVENVVKTKSSSQLPVPPTCDFSDTVGSEFSASALAKMLASGNGDIDVDALIVRANIGLTSFHLQCDMDVYKIMESENISAEKTTKGEAFSYIDLTATAVLPLWFPADAMGGSTSLQTDITDSSTVSLAAIGKALQATTSQKKIFRTHAQWRGCFTEYALAAVATSQLTFGQVLSDLITLSRLQEDEPTKEFIVMVLYVDMFRRTLAKRAKARDPGLVIDSECCVIDKQWLEQDYYFGWLWVVTVVALALTMVALWLCQGGLCFDYMACGSSHYWSSYIEALAVGLALELLLIIALCSVPASLG
jgi:hypothetical protein